MTERQVAAADVLDEAISSAFESPVGGVNLDAAVPAGEAGQSGSERVGTFHALRYRDYRFVWAGTIFSSAAMWIQQTAMSWLVYDLTGSGSILGLVNGIRVVPQLVLAPLAGSLCDRVSRKKIILIAQTAQFYLTFGLALGVAFDVIKVWHLLAFTLFLASANSFDMPARQTIVFDLVPRHVISNAVSLGNLAFSLSRAIGPAVGGLLIVLLGPANNFFLQSLAYLGVGASILMIRMPPHHERVGSRPRFFREMAAGYRFALQNPQARVLLLIMAVHPLFLVPLQNALLPIFAKDIFHAGAGGLGILLGAIGVGGVIGSLLIASLSEYDRRGMLQLKAMAVCAASQALFAIVGGLTGNLWLSVGFLLVAGIGSALYFTTNQTVMQLLAPDDMRGRITSVLQISPFLMSISTLAGGAAADFFPAPMVGAATNLAGLGVTLLIGVFSPSMRRLSMRDLVHESAAGAG